MKTALILTLSCATFALAQDMKTAPPAQSPTQPDAQASSQPSTDKDEYKRLASVTWDLDSHKLVWVVQRGIEVDGAFVPKTVDRYEVSPSDAFMALKEEKRGIADDEAKSLHDLLGVLTLYCVESTVWWENGGNADDAEPTSSEPPAAAKPGKKTVDKKADPPADPPKPTRVDQPEKKPAYRLLPDALVADNGIGK